MTDSSTLLEMDLPDEAVRAAIRAGCNEGDIHLVCSFPNCTCKQMPVAMPAAIRAALQAWCDCGMASFTPGLGKPGDAPPYITIRLSPQRKDKEP